MIVITGASGHVGRHVVSTLLQGGQVVRAVTRDHSKAGHSDERLEVVEGNLDDPPSLERAFKGASKAFLLSPGPDITAQDSAAIRMAMKADVSQVVFMSALGAKLGGLADGGLHLPGEDLLSRSAMRWTVLHPSEFMTNSRWFAGSIKMSGFLRLPAGTGRISFVDPADVGAIAAHILTTDGHHGMKYALTGPQALGFADVVSIISNVLGVEGKYVDITADEYRDMMKNMGFSESVISRQAGYYAAVRDGRASLISPQVRDLLGRAPTTYADWASRHLQEVPQQGAAS